MEDHDFTVVRKNLNILSVVILLLAFSNPEIERNLISRRTKEVLARKGAEGWFSEDSKEVNLNRRN